jgi:type IV secretion system protein VirD4
MTHLIPFLILTGLVLLPALGIKSTVFSSQQVRRMRWRTKVRLRPGPGFASHWEITFRFSRLAALYHGRRCRPDMRITDRLVSPARMYAVRLGRAQLGRKAYGRGEDQVGIIAPQRTNKTGTLADRVYGHPGAAVPVTTRADLYRLTSGKRAQLGPVQVFNPEGIGGIESTFQVDIVTDCADPEVAIRTAYALTGPTDGSGDMQFWLEKAVFALAALLHAAALLGEDMSAVWRWSQRLGDPIRDALARPGASPELLAAAAEIQREGKSADSIRMTMARSLAWVGVPALRSAVSGKGIRPFNAAQWVHDCGTLYVINSGELSAAAPLFRAVIEKVHRDCVFAGSLTPYGRLPNPVLFALDEVTQTAAVPLAEWLATSAGSGIQVCFIVHTPAQLRARYGKDTADAIWALAGTKIVLGGNTDKEMAEDISTLCGNYGGEMADPVVPAAYLRQLPESRALVLAMNRSPLAVKVRPVWRRLSFRLRLNPAAYQPLPAPRWIPELVENPGTEGEAA